MKVIILVTVMISVAFSICPGPPQCPPGTRWDATLGTPACVTCEVSNCMTCADATTCTACFTGYTKDAVASPNTCTVIPASAVAPIVCAQGQYLDATTTPNTCKTCMTGCAKCDAADTCLWCDATGATPYYRTKDMQSCTYKCSTIKCTAGANGCFKCKDTEPSENLCLACSAGWYYNGFTGKCAMVAVSSVCPVPTGQTQGYFWNGARCLVCDSNCKTCAAAATTCTTCNDGYDLAVDKCNVTPVDPGTGSNSTGNGTGNQTNGTGSGTATGGTTTSSSSLGKWLLIGGVVLFLLVVVGGIVMFVMNKSDEEHDESRSEEREEEDLDTRRDDNYELTETKMDHHTMDRDMDH